MQRPAEFTPSLCEKITPFGKYALHHDLGKGTDHDQTVAEVESNFRCGGMNTHYAKLTILCTIIHTNYAKYMNLGVAEATACQIATSATSPKEGR